MLQRKQQISFIVTDADWPGQQELSEAKHHEDSS
jgi:hypothetical protein